MKAQYKLGQFVEFTTVAKGTAGGKIEGVIFRPGFVFYEVMGCDDEVAESSILEGFRPIVARKTKPKKEKTMKEPKAKAVAVAQEQRASA